MLAQKVTFVNSGLSAKISDESVIIEPQDRRQGFGVALELAEAIQFAKLILEMEAHLRAEMDERLAEHREMDGIGEFESLSPWR